MVSREVKKSQEFFSVFFKALSSFGVLDLIGLNE
jgi:hypothetical protein